MSEQACAHAETCLGTRGGFAAKVGSASPPLLVDTAYPCSPGVSATGMKSAAYASNYAIADNSGPRQQARNICVVERGFGGGVEQCAGPKQGTREDVKLEILDGPDVS